ncbi:MAG: hypothetical protein AAB817_02520, partial [Patescibacteria group bacterium]
LQQLFEQHRFWSRFFDLLEQNTSAAIAYRSVAVDTQGRIIITATGANYLAVAEQLARWQATVGIGAVDFSTAAIPVTTGEPPASGVVFTVAMTLTPDFLQFSPL